MSIRGTVSHVLENIGITCAYVGSGLTSTLLTLKTHQMDFVFERKLPANIKSFESRLKSCEPWISKLRTAPVAGTKYKN
jgi:hypothetical protein